MNVLFQRGVSLGMASAAASQPQNPASSVFGPYQVYPPYNISQYNPFAVQSGLVENDASHGLHIHANSFGRQTVPPTLPQTLGQFNVPTISQSQTAHYMQYPSWVQRTNNYQWPPVAPSSEGTNAVPTVTKEDIR